MRRKERRERRKKIGERSEEEREKREEKEERLEEGQERRKGRGERRERMYLFHAFCLSIFVVDIIFLRGKSSASIVYHYLDFLNNARINRVQKNFE